LHICTHRHIFFAHFLKIKGKKNYLLFNIIPEGNPKELEAELIKNDLVITTDGVIPYQFRPNVDHPDPIIKH
jgi:hypothetical protein